MTVQQLIELLEQFDPTAEVVLAGDPEGNSFSTLEDVSEGFFNNKESSYYSDEDLSYLEDTDAGDEDENARPGGIPCVCFWPSY